MIRQKIRLSVIALSALLFLLPWQTQKILRVGALGNSAWEYGTIGVYATQLIIAVLLVWHRHVFARDCRILWERMHLSLRLLFLWLVLSLAWSIDPVLAAWHLLWVLEPAAIAWLLYQERERATLLIGVFVAGMLFQAVVAIVQVLNQDTVANVWLGWTQHDPSVGGTSVIEVNGRRFLRGYGGMGHPNVLGAYLVAALLVLMAWMRSTLPRIKNEFVVLRRSAGSALLVMTGAWLSFLVLLAGLFFTFSRSAWAVLVLGLVVMVVGEFLRSRSRRMTMANRSEWLKMLIALIVVFASLGWLWREPSFARLESRGRLETKSIEERREQLSESTIVLKGHWVHGTGLGNYTNTLAQEDPKPTIIEPMFQRVMRKPAWMYQPVHNVFLLMLSEIGIIGVLLLLWALKDLWKTFRSATSVAAPILYSLFASLFALSLLDHYLWSLHAGWLLVGFVIFVLISFGNKETLRPV